MGLLHFIANRIRGDFFSPAGYFFWGWVSLYIVIGTFLNFRAQEATGSRATSLLKAFKSCFPKKSFWSASARLDYQIILLSDYLILYPIGLITIRGQDQLAARLSPHIAGALAFLGLIQFPLSNGFWVDAIYTLFVLIAADLGWTIQHILFHRIPYLWQFHKVHHSATELNIFTIARLHPIDVLSQCWAAGICVGTFMGLCKVALGYTPSLVLFMNVSWAMAFYRVFGIYRHSHYWISFGPRLSRFFCSPAMHQVHHSIDERHYDKNFSTVFSFWDRLFGTLYVPKSKEALHFGIPKENLALRKYDSFLRCLLQPFFADKALCRWYGWKKDKTRLESSLGDI